MSLLNILPFNGYKTYIGIIAGALVLGLSQLGYIDPSVAQKVMEWIALWTGMALVHKADKAIAAAE